MASTYTLRAKHFIATHTWSLIVLLCCLTAISAVLLATPTVSPAVSESPYADPPETSPPQTHTVMLEQHTQTTVTKNTTAWPANQTLSDRSRYPRHNISTPRIEAVVDSQHATVSNVTIAIIYTVSPATENSPAFYRDQTTLTDTSLSSDQRVTVSLPIDAIANRSSDLQSQFGPRADVTVQLRVTAQYSYTSTAGDTYSDTISTAGPIGLTDSLLTIPHGTVDESHSTGSLPPSTPFRGSIINLLSAGGVVGSVISILIVSITSYQCSPSTLAQQLQHVRHQDWITTVDSYTPEGRTRTVSVSSLPELVDLAIDHHVRTLYHRPTDEYLVPTDDVIYKYRPPRSQEGRVEFFGLERPDEPLPPFNPHTDTQQSPFESSQPLSHPGDHAQQPYDTSSQQSQSTPNTQYDRANTDSNDSADTTDPTDSSPPDSSGSSVQQSPEIAFEFPLDDTSNDTADSTTDPQNA